MPDLMLPLIGVGGEAEQLRKTLTHRRSNLNNFVA